MLTKETTDTRTVPCPECHAECAWCSWYVKNARGAGCGSSSKRKCEKGQSLLGTVCQLCGGAEHVEATTTFKQLPAGALEQKASSDHV